MHLPRLPSPSTRAASSSVVVYVFGNTAGFSPYIHTSRSRLNPTCMATRMESFQWKTEKNQNLSIVMRQPGRIKEKRRYSTQSRKVARCSASSSRVHVSVQRPASVASAGLHLWWLHALGYKRNSSSPETLKACQLSSFCSLNSTRCTIIAYSCNEVSFFNVRDFLKRDRHHQTAATRWKILSAKVFMEAVQHYSRVEIRRWKTCYVSMFPLSIDLHPV